MGRWAARWVCQGALQPMVVALRVSCFAVGLSLITRLGDFPLYRHSVNDIVTRYTIRSIIEFVK